MNNDTPSGMLARAISAVRNGGGGLLRMLNELPAAIYITDTQGVVTHFNQTCIAFAGRTPRVGQDSWCVTWKLYTEEGEYLPHNQCPMAVAIRERRIIRGARAVATAGGFAGSSGENAWVPRSAPRRTRAAFAPRSPA